MAFDFARATKYFLMWDFIKGFALGMRYFVSPKPTLDQPVWSPGDYGERSGRSRIRSCIPGSKAKPNKKYNKPRQKLHLTREDYRIDSSR